MSETVGPGVQIDALRHDGVEVLPMPDADVLLHREAPLGRATDELFTRLADSLQWRRETIVLFGKTMWQPRLLAWYGDAEAVYRYSGMRHEPLPWTPLLAELRERIEAISGERFNSVLANLYRDHRDSMGLHSDDERELGERPVIASLSLGEERVFRFRHRYRKDLGPVRLSLTDGSLLLMRGATQANWKHEVPKQSRACGPRINLTFRRVFPRGD